MFCPWKCKVEIQSVVSFALFSLRGWQCEGFSVTRPKIKWQWLGFAFLRAAAEAGSWLSMKSHFPWGYLTVLSSLTNLPDNGSGSFLSSRHHCLSSAAGWRSSWGLYAPEAKAVSWAALPRGFPPLSPLPPHQHLVLLLPFLLYLRFPSGKQCRICLLLTPRSLVSWITSGQILLK